MLMLPPYTHKYRPLARAITPTPPGNLVLPLRRAPRAHAPAHPRTHAQDVVIRKFAASEVELEMESQKGLNDYVMSLQVF
jgi:hypothetical protein